MKNFWINRGTMTRAVFLMETDKPTFSKRIYPRAVIERAIGALEPVIAARGLMGHLDHPPDSIIHLSLVSHLITKLELIGNELWAEIEVLNTPHGRVLKSLLEADADVVFATTGVGSGRCNESLDLVVSDSYKLITVNAVAKDGVSKLYPNLSEV